MRHKLIISLLVALLAFVPFYSLRAQSVITESEILDLAMKNSAALQSSELQVQQNKYLQKTGFSLPNPEVIAESPTGQFYAVGILQTLEFPTVYAKQSQLRKQMTKLSERQREVTKQDINRFIRSLYLNFQLAEALYNQLLLQDTLYAQIAKTADRQFNAGTIDYLAKIFAETQAGEIHNQVIQTREEYEAIRNQLKTYTAIDSNFNATPLIRSSYQFDYIGFDSSMLWTNPSIRYYKQLKDFNKNSLSLERNKALPGLVFGYLNQGSRETDTYYRFRVGFTVPLWFWQYNANIKAAKTGIQIADQDSKAQQQTLTAELHQSLGDLKKYHQALSYYEGRGLMRANEIINTARRFFESGQTDYISYLRNTNEAYLIKARYLETLKNYNQAVITVNYLTGKL